MPTVIGFLRYRTRSLDVPKSLADYPLMNRISIFEGSPGRALRSGKWKLLGRDELHPDFGDSVMLVQCPVGTNNVIVWQYENALTSSPALTRQWETRIDDPEIQDFEVMAVWDAEYHIPERLKGDYGEEEATWHVGGPVWRHRRVMQETARRFPDQPWHKLPTD